MTEKTYKITGMTCSNCALGIEKAVSELKVESVTVSLMQKNMTVKFNTEKVSEAQILKTVKKIGYGIEEQGLKASKNSYKQSDANRLKKRFIFSLILVLPLLYLSMQKMLGLPGFLPIVSYILQAVLSLSVMIINFNFFDRGLKAVLNKMPNMDTLVALGSISAYLYSVTTLIISVTTGKSGYFFFESSAMVLTLVTLGKWLEEISKTRSGSAVEKLIKLMPNTVTIVNNGGIKIIDKEDLKVGDIILVRAGEYISVDGTVLDGEAGLDKSAITGESFPEEISKGGKVISGSLLVSGYLHVKADRVGENTFFSGIINSILKAGASKAPVQRFADKVASVFVPVVTSIAVLTFIIWISLTGDLYRAFNFSISVLVISCPCALGLATPVAITAAVSKGAEYGVLYKNATSVEKSAFIEKIYFDKTGTLTKGAPRVESLITLSENTNIEEILSLSILLEEKSSHPLAKSITTYAERELEKLYLSSPENTIEELSIDSYTYISGKGVKAMVNKSQAKLGNTSLLTKLEEKAFSKVLKSEKFLGKTLVCLSFKDQKAVFVIADEIKPSAYQAIKELKSIGVTPVLITGDNWSTAKIVAEELGIEEYHASLLPDEKQTIIQEQVESGKFVAMVGDGINDGPALKSSSLGISMGKGTDVAIDVSDVVINTEDVTAVVKTLVLGKRTKRVIKSNLFWAFFYNSMAIPVAAGALSFIKIALSPMLASTCMCISSLFVVLNALRITKFNLSKKSAGKSTVKVYKIRGMHCVHCVEKVKNVIKSIKGVKKVKVSLKKGVAAVKGIYSEQLLMAKVQSVGFKVE